MVSCVTPKKVCHETNSLEIAEILDILQEVSKLLLEQQNNFGMRSELCYLSARHHHTLKLGQFYHFCLSKDSSVKASSVVCLAQEHSVCRHIQHHPQIISVLLWL